MNSTMLLIQKFAAQRTAAQQVATTPTAIAPPAINVGTPTLQPTGTPPPALAGLLPQPSTAMMYSSGSPPVDFASAANVQAAAIQPDPTALTQDNLTPAAQAENRATLIKLVAAGVAIWLILSATGR